MPTLEAGALRVFVGEVLEAAGTPAEIASEVADSLVRSNLKGVDSHGLVRVVQYLREIESGRIIAGARPVVSSRGAVVVVDGCWGFGQVAARRAATAAAERGADTSVAAATVASVQHVGRLGEYVETVAAAGLVALAFCNTGPPGGNVVPFGGSRARLSTNPLAYALPTRSGDSIVADFSTSAAAEGRLRLARQNGLAVPEGWIVDADGNPTTDPGDFYDGGALLPAGGHRGYALSLLVEILGGVLAGAGCSSAGDNPGNGLVLIAVDPAGWRPRPSFLDGVDRVVDALHSVPPAAGFERVLVPGEPEAAVEAERLAGGIPIPEATWAELGEAAAGLGVPAPAIG